MGLDKIFLGLFQQWFFTNPQGFTNANNY